MNARLAILFVLGHLGVAACGGAPARAPAPPATGAPGAVAREAPPAVDPVPSLDALAARGASEAPLMREIARAPSAAPRSAEVRAERDLCLRAAFASSRSVKIAFADGANVTRGDATVAAAGMVPPKGPACVTKGDALHLVVDAPPETVVRAVIFAAP
ncbi:MAG: hypothetical protein KF819_17055 [Labilithrix sp.]|nr:hypothetical protein [Labilithrix sp.]